MKINYNKINIAVLMCCHNRVEKTLKSIEKIKISEGLESIGVDVYLIDDGSTDSTFEVISNKYPTINIYKKDGNLFWNRGMYCAWEYASKNNYDYYLWLNDDTYVYKNSISKIINSSKKINNKSILVGSTVNIDGIEITYGGYSPKGEILKPNSELQECNWFNGNFVLIPREVFITIGNLDYKFRHSLGDFDYGIRAKKKNIKIFVEGEIVGICESHEKIPQWINRKYNVIKRFNNLYSPLGCNPIEYFIFECRRSNIYTGSLKFIAIHIRALVPDLYQSIIQYTKLTVKTKKNNI